MDTVKERQVNSRLITCVGLFNFADLLHAQKTYIPLEERKTEKNIICTHCMCRPPQTQTDVRWNNFVLLLIFSHFDSFLLSQSTIQLQENVKLSVCCATSCSLDLMNIYSYMMFSCPLYYFFCYPLPSRKQSYTVCTQIPVPTYCTRRPQPLSFYPIKTLLPPTPPHCTLSMSPHTPPPPFASSPCEAFALFLQRRT